MPWTKYSMKYRALAQILIIYFRLKPVFIDNYDLFLIINNQIFREVFRTVLSEEYKFKIKNKNACI